MTASAKPLSSWHAQRSAGAGGTRVFNREWRAKGDGSGAPDANFVGPVSVLTPDQIEDVKARYRAGNSTREIARVYGVAHKTIHRYVTGETGTAVKSAADYAVTIPGEPFVPLCMSPDELADWNQLNRTAAFAARGKALSPCEDCLLGYAIEMRAIGKCNGTPGAAADVEDDEPEEPAARRTMASVKATVTAPCESCAHQPVCDRLGSLERLAGQINVESTPLHAGLMVAISASIDCDAYLRVRTASDRPPQSLEQRQASSERMKATRARQRAEREAAAAAD